MAVPINKRHTNITKQKTNLIIINITNIQSNSSTNIDYKNKFLNVYQFCNKYTPYCCMKLAHLSQLQNNKVSTDESNHVKVEVILLSKKKKVKALWLRYDSRGSTAWAFYTINNEMTRSQNIVITIRFKRDSRLGVLHD